MKSFNPLLLSSFIRPALLAGVIASSALLAGCSSMPSFSSLSSIANPFSDDEADASEEKGQAARQIHAAPVYDVTQSRAQNVLRFYCETEVKDLSEAAAAKDAHPLPDLLRNAEPSTFGESYRDYFSPSKIADFFGKAATNVLRGEDMKPRLLGFVPVDVSGIAGAPLSRSDAERRFVSQSASLIKAGAESLGLEVAGNTRGYRLEGMIEGASELRLTLVSPALGCPAPKEAAAAPHAQTAGQMSAGRRTPSPVNPAPARPPEVRCIAKLRLATLDEDASPAVRLPGWLASSGVDAAGSETAVWRFGEGANLTFALPSTAKLTAQELYRAIAVTLPEGWAIYLPPRAVETPNSGELLFRAPLLLEAAGENKFVAP